MFLIPSFKSLRFKIFPRKVQRKAYYVYWSKDIFIVEKVSNYFIKTDNTSALGQCLLQLKLRTTEKLFVAHKRPIKHS